MSAIALTDHDTLDGIDEFLSAAKKAPLHACAGVELSVTYPYAEYAGKDNGSMHILGYFPRWTSATQELSTALRQVQRNRAIRNTTIVEKLCAYGCPLTYEDVRAEAGSDLVGRPHIAAALVKKHCVPSIKHAFDEYLGKGKKAYIARTVWDDRTAIQRITAAGGIAVLAHPETLKIRAPSAMKALLARLTGFGLKGIEVLSSTCAQQENNPYIAYARAYGLMPTGGTDFHGEAKPAVHLGTGFGSLRVPDEWYAPFIALSQSNCSHVTAV